MGQVFEQLMIEHAAPTLMGVKPANLFRCCTPDGGQLRQKVFLWNRNLQSYGVSVEIVKECVRTQAFLIYIYRSSELERILGKEDVRAFLREAGYRLEGGIGRLLAQLSERLCLEEDFRTRSGFF